MTRAPSACLDEAIDLALTAHLSVQALHCIVSDCIEASEGKVPSDLPSAKAIFTLSRLWLEPVPGVLKRVAEQEARGEPLARAEMFRERVQEGRFAVSISPESVAASAE